MDGQGEISESFLDIRAQEEENTGNVRNVQAIEGMTMYEMTFEPTKSHSLEDWALKRHTEIPRHFSGRMSWFLEPHDQRALPI
jgi:hypothetical protein